jgi:hypothetical protein
MGITLQIEPQGCPWGVPGVFPPARSRLYRGVPRGGLGWLCGDCSALQPRISMRSCLCIAFGISWSTPRAGRDYKFPTKAECSVNVVVPEGIGGEGAHIFDPLFHPSIPPDADDDFAPEVPARSGVVRERAPAPSDTSAGTRTDVAAPSDEPPLPPPAPPYGEP